jgi:hypothetical protein
LGEQRGGGEGEDERAEEAAGHAELLHIACVGY